MASETEIANMALAHIGVESAISNLETEKSAEAEVLRVFFDQTRDQVLRDAPWPFATKIITLALVEEQPNDEWRFSYRYPPDTLFIRRILSGIRNDNRQTTVSYRIRRDDNGLLIHTDQQDAQVEYTFRDDDPLRYPADFVDALSLLLAVKIIPRLSAGDPHGNGPRVRREYLFMIDKARAAAKDEEQLDETPQSEFIRTREGETIDNRGRQSFEDFFL